MVDGCRQLALTDTAVIGQELWPEEKVQRWDQIVSPVEEKSQVANLQCCVETLIGQGLNTARTN